MTRLDGAVVVVTGAAGGFGREMTRQLLLAGSFVVMADLRLPALHAAASDVAAALPPVRGSVLGLAAADLATATGCAELHRQVLSIAPTVDILINNAGIGLSGPFELVPQPRWEQLMAVNLLAPMRLTAHFLPAMVARRSGHIVNVSSVAGLVGTPGLAAYSTSKWGLRGFSAALAAEVAGSDIQVTTIYPFFARTAILDAEHWGGQRRVLPPWMIYEPAVVVRALLRGIERNRRHVYPGVIPRLLDLLQRLAPALSVRLTRPFVPPR